MKLISANIEKYMELRGIEGVVALAQKTGLHRNTVKNYIDGKAGINLETLAEIAEGLKVEQSDLAQTTEPVIVKPTPEEAMEILKEALRSRPNARASRIAAKFEGLSAHDKATVEDFIDGLWEAAELKKGNGPIPQESG